MGRPVLATVPHMASATPSPPELLEELEDEELEELEELDELDEDELEELTAAPPEELDELDEAVTLAGASLDAPPPPPQAASMPRVKRLQASAVRFMNTPCLCLEKTEPSR